MGSTVELPLWLVVLGSVFAAWSVLDRLLLPSVRWAVRRRANRAIERLNTRLQLQIQPFKLTKRQILIDRLMYDPEVVQAVDFLAGETGEPREVVMERAQRYAKEIVPSFSAYTYFGFGTRLARRISEMLYRVRIGFTNSEALKTVDPDSSVIFVINHRSNMDYVLVTYVAAALVRTQLRGWRMGAGLPFAQPDPLHGRLFYPPGQSQPALPAHFEPVCPHGNGGGGCAGGIPGRRFEP